MHLSTRAVEVMQPQDTPQNCNHFLVWAYTLYITLQEEIFLYMGDLVDWDSKPVPAYRM